MCLIVCAYRFRTELPFVITANRDEFHARPTRDAGFWPLEQPDPGLLAGQDLAQGGTWLGLTRSGQFAAITNVRSPDPAKNRKSRGLLTSDFLLNRKPAVAYLQEIQDNLDDYSGFNLLLGDQFGLYYLNSVTGEIQTLGPGIYGLSNANLDSNWPKIELSKSAVKKLLETNDDVSTDQLTAIMMDRQQAPDDQLPNTGIPLELERQLSSNFITNPQRQYGTRCTTSIIINQQGLVRFSEQNYGVDTRITSRQLFRFSLDQERPHTD